MKTYHNLKEAKNKSHGQRISAVSYTHLDVYKRQALRRGVKMDLVFLDSNFNTIKFVDYINLQWNRRYYECGQYSVQILARDFDKEFQYVYRASEREIGVVQKVVYTGEERRCV